MAQNTYRVISDKLVGHKRGDKVEGNFHPSLVGVHVDLLEEGKEPCGYCADHGTAAEKKAKFTPSELAEHYQQEHPGLAPPG